MFNFPTTDPIVRSWCAWMLAQSWSNRTVSDRAYLITRVARDSGVGATELTTDDLVSFLARQTIKATTRQTYFASLRAWHKWLVDEGVRPDNPMDGLRRPKAGRQAMRIPRTEHIEHLLSQPLCNGTRTMILLMAFQGLRAFEVAKIAGRDVDLVSQELVVIGKGGVESVIPLHEAVAAEARLRGQGWWFPQRVPNRESESGGHILAGSVARTVGEAMERAGVPGTAHSLRHWYATELLRAGVDTRITQQLMRHATIATTERYLHVDDRQRRAAVERLPIVKWRSERAALRRPPAA